MRQLLIGIIGYGRIGAEHARWISRSAGGRVACVADPTAPRREIARRDGFESTPSVQQLLDRGDLDAVLVASPTSMHLEHARAALAAKKHVMVEKPIALDARGADELRTLAAAESRVLSVFHNRRWDVDFLTVCRAVREGAFGKLINVESRLGQWSSCVGPAAREFRPNWRNEASFGGGGLYDWGSHFVDQMLLLMQPAKPQTVFGQLRGNVWTADCDDLARVCINFDSGAVGLVEINTTTTRPLPRWHVDGTAGSADAPFSLTFDTRAWAQFTFVSSDGASRRLDPAPPGLDEVAIWDQFVRACRGECAPAVTIESVLPTMALLDAARESSRSGVAVRLDQQSS